MKKKKVSGGAMYKPQVVRPTMQGDGFFDWIKGAANTVNDALKKSKVISTVAPFVAPGVGSVVGNVARNLGYGKRQKGGRRFKMHDGKK